MTQLLKPQIFVALITSVLLLGCNRSNEPTDSDGDGFPDKSDAFPSDKSEWVDTDGDLIGNNADTDDDGDGVNDLLDAFPLDQSEWLDTDGDLIGNNADTDDDGDSIPDTIDVDPLDPLVTDQKLFWNQGSWGSTSVWQ